MSSYVSLNQNEFRGPSETNFSGIAIKKSVSTIKCKCRPQNGGHCSGLNGYMHCLSLSVCVRNIVKHILEFIYQSKERNHIMYGTVWLCKC